MGKITENHEKKNLADSETTPNSPEQNQLNAVRDLLFGQNVQEYRTEFDELRKLIGDNKDQAASDLSDLSQKVFDRIDELEKNFDQQLAELSKNLMDEIYRLNTEKADRNSLASLLHELAEKLED